MRAISILLLAFLGLLAATGHLYHRRFERHQVVQAIERLEALEARLAQVLEDPPPAAERERVQERLQVVRRRQTELERSIAGLAWLW